MKTLIVLLLIFLVQSLQAEVCKTDSPHDELQRLFASVENIFTVSTKATNGFFITSYNLKIDEDCKNRMPLKTLESFYRKTMSEGAQCLKSLSSRGNEGAKNLKCFSELFADKQNPPKLLCGGWPFGKTIDAVGSFPGSSKRHPYLWLSPAISSQITKNPKELKATIFHEMLHNCGYTHSEGIEVPYTCEECCFNNDLDPVKKESACNVCGGKYQQENDPNYVRALLTWSKDYKTWGTQMRSRTFNIAFRNANKESLKIILTDLSLSDKLCEEIVEALTKEPARAAEKMAAIKKANPALEKNPILMTILKENNL